MLQLNQMKIVGYIYLTTNTLNSKRYIGMRILRHANINNDCNYLGSGKLLKQAISKYGKDKFLKQILYLSFERQDLFQSEIEIIATYGAVEDPMFYNIAHGGNGVTLRGKNHPRYGKPLPEGHRKALKNSSRFKGHTHTKESKEQIRKAHLGENNFFYGKKHSLETIQILSIKAKERCKINHPMKGKKQSESSIKKNIESQPSRIALVYENTEFYSIAHLARFLKCSGDKVKTMMKNGKVKRK